MSKLVIIRGNSGSGKTTTAKALQHRLGRNIMVLSQDVIRREILWVKDGFGTEALPLLMDMLQYGYHHCETVILEEYWMQNITGRYLSWRQSFLAARYLHIIMI